MAPMRIEQVRELLKYDEMNLDEMGDPGQRTAVFAIMSDTDKTFSFLHAIMMWQSIDILCRRALEKYNGKLPTMVNFIFDEFANIGTIPDIEQTIAVTRSRNIGISIILQSVAQLESRYDKKAKTIIDCCDTTLFLGGKSNSTNKEISEMIGKQTINQKTFGETRGQSGSSSKNIQIQGRDLGHNHCEISRMSTTAEVSILMPFATMELDDKGGNYYGQNKHSSNLIFCNRKLLASPMGFVCGKTGSGKGMAVKTEMTGTILSNPTDEIYIIDRAGEYTGISSRYGGVTYNFAVDSDTYLNPFDTVSVESLSPDAQLAFKIDAMLAQAGASAAEAGRDLGEEDQSIITRCVQEAFFDARQRGEQPPLLEDFYNKLLEQPEPEAKTIALRYERFVTGAQSFFNHQSNVDFKSRIVDFNLKDLPDSMLVFGLINVCEAVRNRMYFNAKRGVRTWLYVEEMQSMFAYPTVLNYFSRFSNEGRKFGLLLTGISQNAVAMLKNKAAQNLVLNSDFLLLLKQSPLDRAEWVRLLGLSEQEEEFIDESVEPGDGLLIAGGARVPIRGKFPSGNVLYDLFSTNPNEAADKKRMQEFAAREKSRLG